MPLPVCLVMTVGVGDGWCCPREEAGYVGKAVNGSRMMLPVRNPSWHLSTPQLAPQYPTTQTTTGTSVSPGMAVTGVTEAFVAATKRGLLGSPLLQHML